MAFCEELLQFFATLPQAVTLLYVKLNFSYLREEGYMHNQYKQI